jgi:hypothetical protein
VDARGFGGGEPLNQSQTAPRRGDAVCTGLKYVQYVRFYAGCKKTALCKRGLLSDIGCFVSNGVDTHRKGQKIKMGKHKVFISYHHANDQDYKNALETMNDEHEIFVNRSVSLGDIDEDEEPQTIREIIRDNTLEIQQFSYCLWGQKQK